MVLLVACGDNTWPPPTFLDAPACDQEPLGGCCLLYPDENAIRACAQPNFPVGSCGVVACQIPDSCAFARINVCNRLPLCKDLACVGIACDETTQLCTCELGPGDYVSCDGSLGA
jgi:hypothetical protein